MLPIFADYVLCNLSVHFGLDLTKTLLSFRSVEANSIHKETLKCMKCELLKLFLFVRIGQNVFPMSHGTVSTVHICPRPTPLLFAADLGYQQRETKTTLIVDYINKNIFVLSWTLIIYFVTNSTISFRSQADPSTRHAFVFVLPYFERVVLRVVSKYWIH